MKFYLSLIAFLIPSLLNAIQHLSFKNGFDEDTTISVKKHAVRYDSYIDVTYEFEGAYAIDTSYKGETYKLFFMQNSACFGEKGDPQLPVFNDLLITNSDSCRFELLNATFEEFENIKIIPSAGERVLDDQLEEWTFSNVYVSEEYFPKRIAGISEESMFKSIPYITLEVNPIQFNPKLSKIRCYKSISFRVHLKSGDVWKYYDIGDYNELTHKASSLIIHCADSLTVEPYRNAPEPYSTLQTKANYLIVTVDKYLPALRDFVTWKTMQGYKCHVISKSNWNKDPQKVKSDITTFYKKEKPEFLLIFGSNDDVPSNEFKNDDEWIKKYRIDKIYLSDLPYAGGSNLFPNMYNGRIPVDNIDTAYNVVNKIINYERYPVGESDFYSSATHCSYAQDKLPEKDDKITIDNYEDGYFIYSSELIRNYMMGWGKEVNRIYTSDQYPAYYSKDFGKVKMPDDIQWASSPVLDVANSFNSGRHYIIYNAHGSYYGWGNVNFLSSDLSRLNNKGKLPVVFSITCLSGGFHKECFASNLINMKNGGAIGVIASSTLSFFHWNDAFLIGMFNTMYPKPGIKNVSNINIDRTFSNLFGLYFTKEEVFKDPVYQMGKVMRNGLIHMYNQKFTSKKYLDLTCREYHYFGDPSMEMFTEKPSCFNPTITQEGTTVTISSGGVDHCKIALTSITGDIIHVAENVEEASFDGISFPYNVVISKHNYKPYVMGSDVYVQNQTFNFNREFAANRIFVGKNVSTEFPLGDVIVNDEKLTLMAKESIHLNPGFKTNGGKFLAHKGIVFDCPFGYERPYSVYNPTASGNAVQVGDGNGNEIAAVTTDLDKFEGNVNTAYLVGNTLSIKLSTPSTVEVYDILGRPVYRKPNLIEGSVTLSPGVYLVIYGDESRKIVVSED
ncbi:MAG: C25 family cysteine peptidase [Bacteroidaceae bacterium]|nr:C25 family cysteine peptidase [Bacteroidaceae bacterium]